MRLELAVAGWIVGSSLAAGSVFWLLGKTAATSWTRLKSMNLARHGRRRRLPLSRRTLTTVALCGAAAVIVAWGSPLAPLAGGLGALLGLLADMFRTTLVRSRTRFQKLRELAVLHESVELFSRAGFTVRQSLQLSLPLLKTLRPAVTRCLDRWPAGPLRALSRLSEEIGLPEAELLTGVLMHVEEAGCDQTLGIMAEEAARLEELRRALAETRLAAKPIYATLYTFMPVGTVLGLVLGPLAYRAVLMIGSLRAP